MSLSGTSPAIRPSASIIVVNSRNEVLLVHRNPKSQSFARAHVFPGGNYDAKQDDSIAMTAIRETFEESGLLLASSSGGPMPSDAELDAARDDIHSQRRLFKDFLAHHKLAPDTSALLPFTQWVTPPGIPRRFHTQFYVVFLNAAPSKGFSSGQKQERLPTPDKGQEVVAARFVHPSKALDEFKAQEIMLMPPQYYLLLTLNDILHGSTNTPEQREKVQDLSSGVFGRMVINPRPLPKDQVPQGRAVLTYEGDETRGGLPGRMHRSVIKWGKGGVPDAIELKRNFDVFTEIEEHLFASSGELSKL